ncbi:MAG TPA: type II toxin-antitoxin system RelE/ParE family toxin [Acidobacteriaceae bacterium]
MCLHYTEQKGTQSLIKSFKHKGLERFYRTDSKAGIIPAHAERLRDQLTALTFANVPRDMDRQGWFLHPLHGRLEGHWSVRVSGNWRLTFRFDGPDAEIVNYQDYH